MSTQIDSTTAVARTLMLAGEVVVPGASNLVAGNVGTGLTHLLATGVVVSLLAPTMPLLAVLTAVGMRVNSYKLATTGSSLLTTLTDSLPQQTKGTTAKAT